jgi:ribosome-binding factor A
MLLAEIKDPRVAGAVVSDVRVSSDLSHASVYVRADAAGSTDGAIAGLEHAAGFIRRELGRTLRLRKIPEFRFLPDQTFEHVSRIEELLRQARDSDERGGT